MTETRYMMKKETADEVKKLARASMAGELSKDLHRQKTPLAPVIETRIFRTLEDIDGAEVTDVEAVQVLQTGSGEATWHFSNAGDDPNLAPNENVVETIYNMGFTPIRQGTFVICIREPYSGHWVCDDKMRVWRARVLTDVVESGPGGSLYIMDLDLEVEEGGDGITGWRGVAFGEREGIWEGDIIDVMLNSDGFWIPLGCGLLNAHGTATEDIAQDAAGEIELDNGITIEATAHQGPIKADDKVMVHWVGRGVSDLVHWCVVKDNNTELEAGCGIDIDEDGVISVDNTALAGTGLQASGECGLAVNLTAGCGINVAGATISVNAGTLAGSGLVTEGTCSLAVNPGCGIAIVGDTVEFDPSAVAGSGLEVAGAGCALNVKVACGLALVAEGVRVDNSALAGSGLIAGDGCSLDIDCDFVQSCVTQGTCEDMVDCIADEESGLKDAICDAVGECLSDPMGDLANAVCNAVGTCLSDAGSGLCDQVRDCVFDETGPLCDEIFSCVTGDPMLCDWAVSCVEPYKCIWVLDCLTSSGDVQNKVIDIIRQAGFCEPPCFEPAPLWEGLAAQSVNEQDARIAALESQVASLSKMVSDLQARLAV